MESSKCKCLTAKGDRCSRLGKPEYHGYCFQHKDCKTPVKTIKVSPNKSKVKKPIKVDKKPIKKIDDTEHKRALRKLAKIEALEKRIAAQSQIVRYKPKPLPKPIKKVKKVSPVGMPYMPREMMVKMFQHMDPKTVIQTCTSSKYNDVCDNDFWILKLKQDFGISDKRKTGVSKVYKDVARFYYDIEKAFDTEMKTVHYYTLQITEKTAKYFMSSAEAKKIFKGAIIPFSVLTIRKSGVKMRSYRDKYTIWYEIGDMRYYTNPTELKDGVPKQTILLSILRALIPPVYLGKD